MFIVTLTNGVVFTGSRGWKQKLWQDGWFTIWFEIVECAARPTWDGHEVGVSRHSLVSMVRC